MYSDVRDELRAESKSGRVALSHIRSDDISVSSVSGKIELTDVIAAFSLYAENVSGGAELDRCDADKLKLKSTSGSVKGTLLSGKTFTAHSVSGSVDIPFSASGGDCEISTTSGSIRIEIDR